MDGAACFGLVATPSTLSAHGRACRRNVHERPPSAYSDEFGPDFGWRPNSRARGKTATAGSQRAAIRWHSGNARHHRSEEHTSELQSHLNLVCRLLLEK